MFGSVVKQRHGVTKRRLVLGAKEPGATGVAFLFRFCVTKKRALLPDALNLAFDGLRRVSRGWDSANMELSLMDVQDAIWALPPQARERRFFVGTPRGWHLICRRLAQGSRGAPWRGADSLRWSTA